MACAISIVLALVGFIAMSTLPIEQYPNIAPPQVEVTATYSGADPKNIIQSVISPLEESINGVDGMDYMVSKATSTGTATIDVYFKQGCPQPLSIWVLRRKSARTVFYASSV